jgi:pimeloyl-ACP methyl ester carboxylesterase/DNA-binding SARP family transcriptional activator
VGTTPAVRYARSQATSLAYQAFGDGPPTMVAIPPMAQNIELTWERPEFRHMFERFSACSRFVHFDKSGTGASDRSVPVPSLDQRVDEVRAVMDAAEVDRAFLLGVSEGGPVALMFAVTYPDRVEGLVLDSTAHSFGDGPEEDPGAAALREMWLDRWGTEETVTLDFFAPSLAADAGFRSWQPRYERQSASPAAMRDLVAMIAEIDVTDVLPQVWAPTVAVHRRGDPIVPLARARETIAAIPGATLHELDGVDHFSHAGDTDAWLDVVEAFVSGAPRSSDTRRHRRPGRRVAVRTLGGFVVQVDGVEVPLSAWGSRRARQLCKRLAAARHGPVTRSELIELLWPDDPALERLGARLSVQLSTVRRVLDGGVVADRDTVRLDPDHVDLDLVALDAAIDAGDDEAVLVHASGEFLPEDRYEDWTEPVRERSRLAVVGAARRAAEEASRSGDHERAALFARRVLEADPYDGDAHRRLVVAFAAADRPGEARRAHRTYQARMAELGVPAAPLEELLSGPRST